MIPAFVVSLLAVISGGKTKCGQDEVVFRGRCYEQEILVDNLDRIQNLVVDFHTNVLYFSNGTYFKTKSSSSYYDLNTKELGVITQVPDGRAQAVDQVRHEVYIGGNDGFYKYYYNNKTAERVVVNDDFKKSMFFKDYLYYSNEFRLYTVRDGQISEVDDMRGEFTRFYMIDKDDYQFFIHYVDFAGKMKGSNKIDRYDGLYLYSMTTDANGVAYLCSFDKIYFVNKDRIKLQTVGTLPNWCDNLAFDKDNNVIYSAYDRIIRLKLKSGN